MSSLNSIVVVNVTRNTIFPTRKGFGIPMLAVYHTKWAARARRLESIQEAVDAGVDPLLDFVLYSKIAAEFSQNPRPEAVIIGKRTRASTQVLNLTPLSTATGYVYAFDATNSEGVDTPISYTVPAVGVASPSISTVFASGGKTATRASGDFVADGFVVGQHVTFPGSALNTGSYVISAVVPLVITMATATIATETIATTAIGQVDQSFIAKGLATLLDAIADSTATAASGVITMSATPGKLINLSTLPPISFMTIADVSTDPGIAADLAEISTEARLSQTTSFYGFTLDHACKAITRAAAAWTEANGYVFVYRSSDSACADPASTTDVMYLLKQSAYKRTWGIFAQSALNDFRDDAWMGSRLPQDPGTNIWAFSQLAGIAGDALQDGESTAIENKFGTSYHNIAGVNVTFEGHTSAGEFADIVISSDFIAARLQEAIFGGFLATVFDFTDQGIAALVGLGQAVLDSNISAPGNKRMFSPSPAPKMTCSKKAAQIDPSEKASRRLLWLTGSGEFSGAIQGVKFQINISV